MIVDASRTIYSNNKRYVEGGGGGDIRLEQEKTRQRRRRGVSREGYAVIQGILTLTPHSPHHFPKP